VVRDEMKFLNAEDKRWMLSRTIESVAVCVVSSPPLVGLEALRYGPTKRVWPSIRLYE
jgi:hypothetical protein